VNYRFIAKVLGQIQILIALSMLTALPWSYIYHDGDHSAILEAFAVTALIGAALWIAGRNAPEGFFRREAMAIVGLGWLLSAVTGSLPFIFSHLLGPVDAFFETMSGLTGTGSTVITNIDTLLDPTSPIDLRRHGVLFWRSFSHFLGGMGIVVLLLAFLPAVGAASKLLFESEVPGPESEGLKPRIRQTAVRLWVIYVGFNVAEFVLLWVLGMSLYSAMCHAFGTIGTGGFSTHNMSIGHYHSLAIELVVMVFIFLSGTSFNLHYHFFHGRWRVYFRDTEWRTYALLLLGAILVIAFNLLGHATYPDVGFPTLLRWSSFTTLSVATNTGFVTANSDLWPTFSRLLLIALMLMGGCAGSTSGGLKIVRVVLLAKMLRIQLLRFFNPRRVFTLRLSGRVINEQVQFEALVYFVVYLAIFVISSLIIAYTGVELITAVSAVAATLSTTGPGLAGVGAYSNFAQLPDVAKLVCSFCMVAGRLEVWAVVCLFAPSFWMTRRSG
jgi:trk system potassium uptake protein TrkH